MRLFWQGCWSTRSVGGVVASKTNRPDAQGVGGSSPSRPTTVDQRIRVILVIRRTADARQLLASRSTVIAAH